MIINGDAQNLDLSRFKKYGVIVADPPWLYRVNKGDGVAENHYSVMTTTDLMAMPVQHLSAPDCILFLWGTWPKLPEAVSVMAAWGFEHLTGFPWIKTTKNGALCYGVGYWVRGCSEYVLVGRKGHVSPPEALDRYLGILSPRMTHSRKPASVHEIAETLPGPYLELFARRPREGWDTFGNEVKEEWAGLPLLQLT
jgi:site-specific DNA-methyltransferase (adenine-specific)